MHATPNTATTTQAAVRDEAAQKAASAQLLAQLLAASNQGIGQPLVDAATGAKIVAAEERKQRADEAAAKRKEKAQEKAAQKAEAKEKAQAEAAEKKKQEAAAKAAAKAAEEAEDQRIKVLAQELKGKLVKIPAECFPDEECPAVCACT